MYFFNRRPRGFHYTMRFSNERRDLIDSLRRGVPPDVLAQRSLEEEAQHASRGRSRRHGRGLLLMIGGNTCFPTCCYINQTVKPYE